MKKGRILIIAIIAIVAIIVIWSVSSYNSFVKKDENVTKAWAQVENVYQRRADLIPNLVATVKGYAAHESSTLEGVIEARSKATQVVVDPSKLTPETLEKFQAAQTELSSALGRLLLLQENYPNLKANQNFLDLQAQLEGTENRIAVERKKFNEAAQSFNTSIRVFPKNIIAKLFDFEKKAYFEAEEGANVAPKVEF